MMVNVGADFNSKVQERSDTAVNRQRHSFCLTMSADRIVDDRVVIAKLGY